MTAVEQATQITPAWMTVAEVSAYSRRHAQTIYTALREYRSTNGRCGLRGSQTVTAGSWRVRMADVDAWLNGDKPKRRRP